MIIDSKIENYFESSGYKFYSNTGSFASSDGFYQKKIKNEVGIKYFIEFVVYSLDGRVIFMANLNINPTDVVEHQTYKIHHLTTLDKILQAEKNIESFWRTFGDYYEVFSH
jgi:hypothetical protein